MNQKFHFDRAVLGETLKRCRKLLDYSLRDLAKLSGVSASHILRIESGEYDFQVETLMKIAIHLGIPCGVLLEEGLRVNWLYYHEFVQKDATLNDLLPSKTKPISTLALQAVRFAAVECAVTAKLLWSSNPSMLAGRYDYPCASLKDAFCKAAVSIGQSHGLADRAAMLQNLQKEPVAQLTELGVLNGELLSEYLGVLTTKKITNWNGLTSPLDHCL